MNKNLLTYIVGVSLGFGVGANVGISVKKADSVYLQDLNRDDYQDVIIDYDTLFSPNQIFLGQSDGTFISLKKIEKDRKNSLEEGVEKEIETIKHNADEIKRGNGK